MNYLIATGSWWPEDATHTGSVWNQSSPITRSPRFFRIWYELINRYSNPDKIILTDSQSPLLPDFPDDPRLEITRLSRNFGHALDGFSPLCGWTRSFLNGLFLAYLNDFDFYIYVEQDCLVVGDHWPDVIVQKMHGRGISFGKFPNSHLRIENSLVVVERRSMRPFWEGYLSMSSDDRTLLPEKKFLKLKRQFGFTEIPFGYGRCRPIDFDDARFFAQHWTDGELRALARREGLPDDWIQYDQ